jgi:ABC-type phosphate/phosphonate transport system substrate-binding protein
MKKRLLLPLLLLQLIAPGLASGSETIRIGVLAKRGAEQALAQWQETANYLNGKISDHHFEIIPLDFMALTPAVASGDIDFVLANSGFYVDFETLFGASRIATLHNRDGGAGYTLFGGVLFTRSDRDDINSIAALSGERLATVETDSLGGFLAA